VANQAVGELSGDVGLGLTGFDVSCGGLDGVRGNRPQFPQPLAFERCERQAERRDVSRLVGCCRLRTIAGDVSPTAEIVEQRIASFMPGTLFQLKTQSAKLLLENLARIDVVGNHNPRVRSNEQCRGWFGSRRKSSSAPRLR